MTSMSTIGGVILMLSAANAAAASFPFRDVEIDPGHPRSVTIMTAEARDCGASVSDRLPLELMPRFAVCMLAHGWVSRTTKGRPAPTENWTALSPLGEAQRGVSLPW